MERFSKDVPVEKVSSGVDQCVGTIRNLARGFSVSRHVAVLQSGVRRIWREAVDLGHGISAAAMGVADEQGAGIRRFGARFLHGGRSGNDFREERAADLEISATAK